MRRFVIALAASAALCLSIAAPLAAAEPRPFGHPCQPLAGVRFCPTLSDDARVPSFDGVPLDVDVTLPASGEGPFPTIVMLHGWGGNKAMFESSDPNARYSNVWFARRGFMVVNYSARGWGRSCGLPASRTPNCARGWTHLADQRYEIRDTQYLLGLLVDQGLAAPRALGVTGISYGGIQSLELAFLRDRLRLPSGRLVAWRSPRGKRLAIAGAWARWGTADLAGSLTVNGRLGDSPRAAAGLSGDPLGVPKQSYITALFGVAAGSALLAPKGADPTADLVAWKAITDAALETAAARALVRQLTRLHSAAGLAGRRSAAPLLIQNGWTDDLFPAVDGIYAYRLAGSGRRAFAALQLGDLGHPRAQNKLAQDDLFTRQGLAFFERFLQGRARRLRSGSVTAFAVTCPASAAPLGPVTAPSWERLARRAWRISSPAQAEVTSSGGDPALGTAINPLSTGACKELPVSSGPGEYVLERTVPRRLLVMGLPRVAANVRASGGRAYLAARLWAVRDGKMILVGRGALRLRPRQQGSVSFQLFGTAWQFAPGDRVRLELLGRDAPFLRPNDEEGFRVEVSKVRLSLPLAGR